MILNVAVQELHLFLPMQIGCSDMKVKNVHFVTPVKYRKKYKKIQVLKKLGKVSPPAANWRANVAP